MRLHIFTGWIHFFMYICESFSLEDIESMQNNLEQQQSGSAGLISVDSSSYAVVVTGSELVVSGVWYCEDRPQQAPLT